MATIAELILAGRLHRLDPALDPDQQEDRFIYVSEKLKNWLEKTLPGLGSTWKIEETPLEQLDALIEVFASGETLTFKWQFKPLNPVGQSIWELKTADLRIFGWFHTRDCFIGICADTKERILQFGLYHGYQNEAAQFLAALDLNEPKCVLGDNPRDVVSNYDLPD